MSEADRVQHADSHFAILDILTLMTMHGLCSLPSSKKPLFINAEIGLYWRAPDASQAYYRKIVEWRPWTDHLPQSLIEE
jgi:hypothetical protein